MEHAYELLAIECVNALFWNYSRDDIQALKQWHPDFAYVWDNYIDGLSSQDAFNTLWEQWMDKFTLETKLGLIDYALPKYGHQKLEALDSAHRMSAFWKKMDDGDKTN